MCCPRCQVFVNVGVILLVQLVLVVFIVPVSAGMGDDDAAPTPLRIPARPR
jgi:hypothetical protein